MNPHRHPKSPLPSPATRHSGYSANPPSKIRLNVTRQQTFRFLMILEKSLVSNTRPDIVRLYKENSPNLHCVKNQ
jgi:hypothetical protein